MSDSRSDYSLASITFSGGERIPLAPGQILVITGPNNCGKSTALRDIHSSLTVQGQRRLVVETGELLRSAEGNSQSYLLHQLPGRGGPGPLNELNRFVTNATTEDRLQAAHSPDLLKVLADSFDKENLLHKHFRSVFRQALILDLYPNLCLYVTKAGKYKIRGEELTIKQSKAISSEESPLSKQGDGMRSFVGGLLDVIASDGALHLIDEPEAFLHAPQVRATGRILGELAFAEDSQRQFIIATHSGDFLRGLLDAEPTGLCVARMTRADEKNHVKILDAGRIHELWNDPLLRFSNVLDALFHEGCIVCEGDADCRFYSAVADALGFSREGPDSMHVGSNGKSGLPKIVNSLKAIGLPTAVIADFDILREKRYLQNLYEALDGDWDECSSEWTQLDNNLQDKKQVPTKSSIQKVLNEVSTEDLSNRDISNIKNVLKTTSSWIKAKKLGIGSLRGGNLKVAIRLIDQLAKRALFAVPIGELENFVREFWTDDVKGSNWVANVLIEITDLAGDERTREVREFLTKVYGSLRQQIAADEAPVDEARV